MRVYLYKNSPIIVCVMAWMTAGSVEPPPPDGRTVRSAAGDTSCDCPCSNRSEDTDECCESLRPPDVCPPDVSDVVDISLRSRSRMLCDKTDGLDCGIREIVFAAERKLLVDGGWRMG